MEHQLQSHNLLRRRRRRVRELQSGIKNSIQKIQQLEVLFSITP